MTTLEQIEGCGLWATLVNGRLTVGPSRRLTDEWRLWIRQHKGGAGTRFWLGIGLLASDRQPPDRSEF